MIHPASRLACLIGVPALTCLVACAPIVATLSPGDPSGPADKSATAPSRHQVRTVMVLPPDSTERDAHKVSEFSALEKELLQRGIRVISAGLTGRVAIESKFTSENGSGPAGGGGGGGRDLSQLERALILAKKSNADALLQVEVLEWGSGQRRFVYKPSENAFEHAGAEEVWSAAPSATRIAYVGPKLSLQGKLIDVESGEVMVALDLSVAIVDLPDAPMSQTLRWESDHFDPRDYGGGTISLDTEDNKLKVQAELMKVLSQELAGKPTDPPPPPPASAAPPPPPPTPPPPTVPVAPPAASSAAQAVAAPKDTVDLTDGTKVQGDIVEMKRGSFVVVQLPNGSRTTIIWARVKGVSQGAKP
jgi:hypothetical protein